MSSAEREAWLEQRLWTAARLPAVELCADVTPAGWLLPLLVPESWEVRMLVPQDFEAYARVLFPFFADDTFADGTPTGTRAVGWREIARRTGRTFHAAVERETLTYGSGADPNCVSTISQDQFDALLAILCRHTSSTEGWFLLWDGYGDLDPLAFESADKVKHPGRDYYLFRGPLSAFDKFPDDPGYWWPDDRAWCVTTDIDWYWAYLAAPSACIDDVLAVDVLDAVRTAPTTPACSGMDIVNDPDGDIPRLP